jgi:hypothetical protein
LLIGHLSTIPKCLALFSQDPSGTDFVSMVAVLGRILSISLLKNNDYV